MFTNLGPETLIIRALVVLVMIGVAFPIHEFAHALAAYRLGDGTAKLMGRLTLDPRAHFDQTGGLLLAASVMLAGFGFGWAKPTPYNPHNLQGGRWGEAIDIANAVAFLLGPESAWMTGEVLRVSGGLEGVAAAPAKRAS